MSPKAASWMITLIFLVAVALKPTVSNSSSATTSTTIRTGTVTASVNTTISATAATSKDVLNIAEFSTDLPFSSTGFVNQSFATGKASGNCTCGQRFRDIYLRKNSNQTSNETLTTPKPLASNAKEEESCQNVLTEDLNGTCVKLISRNCSEIGNVYLADSKNVAYGLVCFKDELRIVSWTANVSCSSLERVNKSNDLFCSLGLNCSLTVSGFLSIDKRSLLDRFIPGNNCSIPIKPTTQIPLLPNPVGPEAVTAIVVLVCLAITAILAGFFFWPKCHMSGPPPKTPKKKAPPPAEAFNVAFSSATNDSVAVVVPPGQLPRGPAAA